MKLLTERLSSISVFDCDLEVSRLLQESEVVKQIEESVAQTSVCNGVVDKKALKSLIFADTAKKESLEEILHPRVRESLEASRKAALRAGHPLFLVDIPLYYETGWKFDNPGQTVAVTACPRELQVERIMDRDEVSSELAEQIVDSQVPWLQKVEKG